MTEPTKRYTDTHPITAVILTIAVIVVPLTLAKCHNDWTRDAQGNKTVEDVIIDKPEPDPLLDGYLLWQSF